MKYMYPTEKHLLDEAKFLIGDGENIEYTRGVIEIITSFMDHHGDCHGDKSIALAEQFGLSQEVIKKLY